MARKHRVTQVTSNPTGSPGQRAQYQLEQAEERLRRGMVGFTAPGKRARLQAIRDSEIAGESHLGVARNTKQEGGRADKKRRK